MESRLPESAADPAVPGGVYLCRIGGGVSCGACCGLYNRRGISRPRLEEILSRRTERFRRIPRTVAAIDAYAREEERREVGPPRWAEVYRCPFLGFTGENAATPGCLLHPRSQGNAGVDYRGLSFYGGLACRDYFCPAHRTLKSPWKRILRAAAADWYAYGILVTEHRLLGNFFGIVEARLGRPLEETDETAALPAFRDFAALALAWPWRDPARSDPGRDPFDDGSGIPPPTAIAHPGPRPSPLSPLLGELHSQFRTNAELHEAESRLEAALSRLAEAVGGAKRGGESLALSTAVAPGGPVVL